MMNFRWNVQQSYKYTYVPKTGFIRFLKSLLTHILIAGDLIIFVHSLEAVFAVVKR